MPYAVITENDESQWNDQTGVAYHFPRRYSAMLQPGTKLIYYKGTMRDRKYGAQRLSPEPHYFGMAVAGKTFPDERSDKGDLFVLIESFVPLKHGIPIRNEDGYLEPIPENKRANYWRDGVRPIGKETYDRILALAVLENGAEENRSLPSPDETNDVEQDLTSGVEGTKKLRYTTTYERDPRLRKQAILIHGTNCAACNFNFETAYGAHGAGYIHVHHIVPLSLAGGPQEINPETDMVPVCANCHAMIHRKKDATLTIEELRQLRARNSRTPTDDYGEQEPWISER